MPNSYNRILLISANTVTVPYPVFPLGVAFLQSALMDAGYEVRIWDQLLHPPERLSRELQWADSVGVSLRNIDNVSSSSPKGYVDTYQVLIKRIRKECDLPIIVGGSAFSIFPDELLESLQVNWGITGEAEKSLILWLQAMAGQRPFNEIPGLIYRTPNGSLRNNPPVVIPTKEIPSPRPDSELIQGYNQLDGMMNAQTQRGCAFRCTYCTYPQIEGTRYRYRNPLDIAAEFRYLEEAGTKYVFITDSVFNTSKRHVRAVCQAIVDEKVSMDWGCFARPQNLDSDLLDLMIEAGMKHIEFGSDSFSDVTLESYGKSFRFKDILEASKLAATKQVHACHYIIFGGPGETRETIIETVANSKQLPDALIFAFSGMRIYPHTPLFNHPESIASSKELLDPVFFKSSGIGEKEQAILVRELTAGNPNWMLSDNADAYSGLITTMRKRGKHGPLWEYLALTRRLAN